MSRNKFRKLGSPAVEAEYRRALERRQEAFKSADSPGWRAAHLDVQRLQRQIGVVVDLQSTKKPNDARVHASDSAADIFARRRAQASAAREEDVHDRTPDRAARAADPAADVYAHRAQEADRTRQAGASAGDAED